MIKIVEVKEIDGKKYVSLEDYQKLLQELEQHTEPQDTAEIARNAGEDEVYND